MNYSVSVAKNGENTLTLNGLFIYSQYRPFEDAYRFIQKEIDVDAQAYFLVGLGLGYHLEALVELSGDKPIIVLAFDKEEYILYQKYAPKSLKEKENIEIITSFETRIDLNNYQIIIPLSWMRALGINHSLYPFLEDIKIRQMSYINFKKILEDNFLENSMRNDPSIKSFKDKFSKETACLVSAGPSLDENIELLKMAKDNYYILAVGSALKVLLENNITPNAVIITDAQPHVKYQLLNISYEGILFYLSTVSREVIDNHKGSHFIIYQSGFNKAEKIAQKLDIETLETGGSVATTAFSLLEYMSFSEIYLFGQDLGFVGDSTHASSSVSRKKVATNKKFRTIEANNGQFIFTTPNLSTYHRWFERKIANTSVHVYNTAQNGAKIKGVPYISEEQFMEKLKKHTAYL